MPFLQQFVASCGFAVSLVHDLGRRARGIRRSPETAQASGRPPPGIAAGAAVNAAARVRAVPASTTYDFHGPILAVDRAPHPFDPGEREAGPPREESPAAAMALSELVAFEDILLDMQADRKRTALGGIADRLAHRVGSSQGAVLAALLRRERLGPTVIGDGVAMPHAPLEGIADPAVAVARLRRPVPFGSPDDAAVDLLFAVLWPKAHAKGFVPALARIWRLLRRTELAAGLRRARTAGEAHALIASVESLPT